MSKKNNNKKSDLKLAQKNLTQQTQSYTAPRTQKITPVSSKRVPLSTHRPSVKPNHTKVAAATKISRPKNNSLTTTQMAQLKRHQLFRKLQNEQLKNLNKRDKLAKLETAKLTVQKKIQTAEMRYALKEQERLRLEACEKRKERKAVMQKIFKQSGFGGTKMKKLFKDMKNSKRMC